MNKEYMQALYDLFGLVAFQKSLTKEQYARLQKYNDIIEQALERLESIDNSNPSEALECLEKLESKSQIMQGCYELNISKKEELENNEEVDKYTNTIKQALLKAQENEKMLEIMKDKWVNVAVLIHSKTVEEYNNNAYTPYNLTQDEFDLLKRWVG